MKAKAFLLTLFLSVTAVSLWAQEKYEYGVFRYSTIPDTKVYNLRFNSVDSNFKEDGKVEGKDASDDLTPMLRYLDKLFSQGWEVHTISNPAMNMFVYHLRKKKN